MHFRTAYRKLIGFAVLGAMTSARWAWRRTACRSDVPNLGSDDLAGIRKGMTPEEVLLAAGQPTERNGDTFVYCLAGGKATVTFGPGGTLQHVRTAKA